MKKLLMIQPGAFGDIFICAPIAKFYSDRGYKVDWPVTYKFYSTVQGFDYVTPILLNEDTLDSDWLRSDVMKIIPTIGKYDKVVNLADRGPHPTGQRMGVEDSEEYKYREAEVPFSEKYTLTWTRNTEKENELYDKLIGDEDYVVAAVNSSHLDTAEVPISEKRKIIYVTEIQGYDITDWYKVLKNSKAIYAVESSIQCFVDGAKNHFPQDKFLLKRSSVPNNKPYTTAKNWKLNHF
tara:strand:- start:754 stop:1464 length:711 start_codon:yes stop_codon:yes gene_type:complete